MENPLYNYIMNAPMHTIMHTHLIASGNWALVTRNVDISLWCSSLTRVLISGYMMGSPTSDRAQCFGSLPSASRLGNTPGTPAWSECKGQSQHLNPNSSMQYFFKYSAQTAISYLLLYIRCMLRWHLLTVSECMLIWPLNCLTIW